jgi:hypothetical protein
MKLNNKDLSNDSRNEFNKHYDEAVNDILFLKDCNISISQIHDITSYQIDFIVFVLQMYQLNKVNNEYTKSIKITSHNINTDEIKKIGYNDALIDEILNSKSGNEYFKTL